MPPHPRGAVYAFEEIDDALPFVPVAARRALDAAGAKLSLSAWQGLAMADRWDIVLAGAVDGPPRPIFAVLARASPAPEAIPPWAGPEASALTLSGDAAPPAVLARALGPGRPIDPARWAALPALGRYALVKYAGKPEKVARAYDEILGAPRLTHLGPRGEAHMIDVGSKPPTLRRALARAAVRTTREVVRAVSLGGLPKGDVLSVARVAGLLASKRTPELVPLCHPVHTTSASIDFDCDEEAGELRVHATVTAIDRTGVEMEAMVAASVAALTIYDMIKSADRWASIASVRLESKSGGKSGDLHRPPEREGT